jgi:uncharacterized protein (TIGR03435 family)
VYAESILKTCEFYIESRLVCVAGVTGSDLKRRIEAIMRDDARRALSGWGMSLLATAAVVVIAVPVGVGALNAARAPAQAAAPVATGPSFEVAAIKPNNSGDARVAMLGEPGGRFTATNVTPSMLIQQAYRLQGGRGGSPGGNSLIVGAPAWVYSDHFDIVAKADAAAPANQMSDMMKSLLAERLKLGAQGESREQQVFAIVLARSDGTLGPQLRHSAIDCAAPATARGRGPVPERAGGQRGAAGAAGREGPGPDGLPPLAPGERPPCGMRIGPGNVIGGGVMLPQLANSLSPFVNRIVLDRTGLSGGFDLDLRWMPDLQGRGTPPPGAPAPAIDPDLPTIFTALQDQLGLKLESTRSQVDVLVIDYIEPPTED